MNKKKGGRKGGRKGGMRGGYLFVALLLMAGVVFGQDPAPAAAPAVPGSPLTEIAATVLTLVLTVFLRWIQTQAKVREYTINIDKETAEQVKAAAMGTYHDMVQGWKAAQNGSLTPEQKQKARDDAFERFKVSVLDMGKGPVKDALLQIGKAKFVPILEEKLGEMKRKNSTPE